MMRAGLKIAAITAVLAAATHARAQISLSTAVDLALRNDPRVLQAEADVTKARAAFAQTHDAYVPTATASGGYGGSTGVPLSVPQVFSLSSSSLLFNFSQKDYVRSAAEAVEAARLTLRETRDKVTEDVVVTYLDLDNAQQRKRQMDDESGSAAKLMRIADDRLQAGQDSKMDLLRARLKFDQVRAAEVRTDHQIEQLSDHLSRLVGMPGNKVTTISSSIPPLPSIDSLAKPEDGEPDSPGIRAGFANFLSKQEKAFGDSRYKLRPEISFGANYSRIYTQNTSYADYYPEFKKPHSDNAASIGIEIRIPLFDRAHEAAARQSEADALSARFAAEAARNEFIEGRFRLRQSLTELEADSRVAQDSADLAEEGLNATLIRLSSTAPANPGETLPTPKDEETARIDLADRRLDLLNARAGLNRSEVSLMRQMRRLDAWLAGQTAPKSLLSIAPVTSPSRATDAATAQ